MPELRGSVVLQSNRSWPARSESFTWRLRSGWPERAGRSGHLVSFHSYHLIRGNTSNWWYGGGEGSVHSSVVAPAPHGLFGALTFCMKARVIPKKKIRTPTPEM